MELPETRYAKSGDLHIAYQVVGQGEPLIVSDQWFGNVDAQWEFPPMQRFLQRLASFRRLVLFDRRGTGLSDPVPLSSVPTLEEWMDDLRAVLDAIGIDRAAVLCGVGAGLVGMLFAATYPERTSSLVLVNAYARVGWAEDYPWGRSQEQTREYVDRIRERWGEGTGALLDVLAPSAAGDQETRARYARYERATASPAAAAALTSMMYENDLRQVLPAIRVPTLVMHRADIGRIPPDHGRYVADRIPGARYVEVPGKDAFLWAGNPDALLGEIEEFLTGTRHAPETDRVLATVLFTDIVSSTEHVAELGDHRWTALLTQHHALVRRELARFKGREVDTAGDGFFVTFDGPARAIRCALAIVEGVRALGIDVRAGVHTGEIELLGDRVGGIAVHVGARVMGEGTAGEVVVSRTVRDLVAGSGIEFEDRGEHELKGVPGDWSLYAAMDRTDSRSNSRL